MNPPSEDRPLMATPLPYKGKKRGPKPKGDRVDSEVKKRKKVEMREDGVERSLPPTPSVPSAEIKREDDESRQADKAADGDGEEEDDQDLEDDYDELTRHSGQDQMAMQAEQAEARAREGLLINSHMSESQLARYEAYRRGGLSRPIVRRYFNSVLNQHVTPAMLPFIAGATKVFVGEVVEMARKCRQGPDNVALSPEDIRRGWREYQRLADRSLPLHKRRLF